jgi:hypothetical protein
MKRFLITTAFIIQGFVAFAQQADSDPFVDLYNRSATWQEKLAILREITSSDGGDYLDFYAKAFSDFLMVYANVRTGSTEWMSANNIAHILITELVAARHEGSGDDFWRCYQVVTDSTVRAEALVALGELKIDSRFADVVRVVAQLNGQTNPTNRQNDENIAAGGFVALEKYGKPEGYLEAFIGSESWYREFVKKTANSALSALLTDPARLLPDIIEAADYSTALKQKALEYVHNSTLANDQKAEVASKALIQGWRSFSHDRRIQRELTDFRRLALQMIRQYGSNEAAATYTAMRRSLQDGNLDEKLDCIPALGALKTPESLTVILDYVQRLNENRRVGASQPVDDRLMRSFIPAMRESSDPRVKDALFQIQSAPWSNTVLGMVKDALDKIG